MYGSDVIIFRCTLRRIVSLFVITSLVFCQTAVIAEAAVQKRSDVDPKYTWNLGDIYKDTQAFEADFSKVKEKYIPQIMAFKGKLTDAKTLLKCL